MGQQLTVRLPANLAEQLERTAKRMRRNRSDVVRLALEEYLAAPTEERPIERLRDLLGQVESGLPDLGERHREYLVKRMRTAELRGANLTPPRGRHAR
ncbi:MAG: ribbon-helix-helix domain-containing protein [Chloroflexi bacterium]|nr:ribbon-helix-helix domain-containing protein [Chloroflexota bacterium]